MEFDHVLDVRSSVRRYTDESVSEEDIEKIVTAGEKVPVGHFDFKIMPLPLLRIRRCWIFSRKKTRPCLAGAILFTERRCCFSS